MYFDFCWYKTSKKHKLIKKMSKSTHTTQIPNPLSDKITKSFNHHPQTHSHNNPFPPFLIIIITTTTTTMATGINEKELTTITRRVTSTLNHLNPPHPHSVSTIITSSTCSGSMNDSYHRIHGEVSSDVPVWKSACDETGKEFTDIVYQKAEGEAIAKVCCFDYMSKLS